MVSAEEAYWIMTNVGVVGIGQKAERKPASVEPASRRRRTDFWASKLDNYMNTRQKDCSYSCVFRTKTHPTALEPVIFPYRTLFAVI